MHKEKKKMSAASSYIVMTVTGFYKEHLKLALAFGNVDETVVLAHVYVSFQTIAKYKFPAKMYFKSIVLSCRYHNK